MFLGPKSPFEKGALQNPKSRYFKPFEFLDHSGWKTDSMFSRYNVTGEEDLREAMERVTTYNEKESKKVISLAK